MSIHQSIQSDQLKFLYQPVVDCATRSIGCAHATLAAHEHEADGQVLFGGQSLNQDHVPTEFILNQILSDLPRLKRMYGESCGVAFTFSDGALADPTFTNVMQSILSAHHLDPAELHVGLAQNGSEFSSSVVATLNELRAIGTPIACAQFGTGALTLRSVSSVDFDILKIDRGLVQRLMTHTPTHSLIAAIAAFCQQAQISLVADGVDDAMILNELEPFNCAGVQGALFGYPVEIEALLPPAQQPLALRAHPAPERSGAPAESIDVLRARIESLEARQFRSDFSSFLAEAEKLKEKLRALPDPAERELACMLGQRVTLAAVYAGETVTPLDWGLETSNLAEDLGLLGVSAQMLALISTVPTSTESSRFVRVEALSRALQIRATTDLDPSESGVLDNSLAMALAHMGLWDRAVNWWSNLIREFEDLDLPGHVYACVNLAEVELARLEDPGCTESAVVRETSLRRIERAVARVARSGFASPGIAEALRARQALLNGHAAQARELFGPWLADRPGDGVPLFVVLKARAMLAREDNQADAYLQHTTQLIDEVADTVMLRIHRPQMMIVHIDALTRAGRLDEALQVQRELRDYEVELGQSRASAMFDWMQIRVDVDLRFAHYVDAARLPHTAKLDS